MRIRVIGQPYYKGNFVFSRGWLWFAIGLGLILVKARVHGSFGWTREPKHIRFGWLSVQWLPKITEAESFRMKAIEAAMRAEEGIA